MKIYDIRRNKPPVLIGKGLPVSIAICQTLITGIGVSHKYIMGSNLFGPRT